MNRDRGNFRWVRPGSHFDKDRLIDLLAEINNRSSQTTSLLTTPLKVHYRRAGQTIEYDLLNGARSYRLTLGPGSSPLSLTPPWRPIAVDEIIKVEVLAVRPGRRRRA
jgi:hypothetical protein